MQSALIALCAALAAAVLLLIWKIALMRRAAEEIRRGLDERLEMDTNTLLSVSSQDKAMRLLASIRGEIGPREIKAALERVGLDPEDPRKVKKYSLGMRQRLGIACAVMEQPELLLLDEPFNGLDEGGCQTVQEIIREQRSKGSLILLACHDRSELETLSDFIYRVVEGRFSLVQSEVEAHVQ